MFRLILILSLVLVASCSSKAKYPNWEYVKVITSPPQDDCVYKVQEFCHKQQITMGQGCNNWHKKRATIFSANTVYRVREQIGDQDGVANYYSCPR